MASKASFEEALKHLRKEKEMFLVEYKEIDRLQTGVVGLDWLLGGGIPRGRIVEIFGPEESGKTTLAGEIVKAYQAKKYRACFLDYEQAVDLAWFDKIGVDVDDDSDVWLFDQPFSLEEGMDGAMELIATGGIGLLVVDSVAAMTPEAILQGDVKDNFIGLQARKMGQTFQKLVGCLREHNTTAIFINQWRQKVGGAPTPFPIYTTPGGLALKFYASIRMQVQSGKKKEVKKVSLKKQKTCSLQNAYVEFIIGDSGIDRLKHLTEMALQTVIKGRAGSYTMKGKKIAYGQDNLSKFIKDNQYKLYSAILEDLQSKEIKDW